MTVTWMHNGSRVITPSSELRRSSSTLQKEDLQLSDAGIYQCVFNDTVNGWMLIRNINLSVIGMFKFRATDAM